MGDVILSLPALKAVREKFPRAAITVLAGKATAQIVELSGFADRVEKIDRVKLRDGAKLDSIREIREIVRATRRRKYDFVIDLHSLAETNLLAFLSGAKKRLLSRRENRSLDLLNNFKPAPPAEDKSKHVTERYLAALAPLGLETAEKFIRIEPTAEAAEKIAEIRREKNITAEKTIGIFPGAGHPSRCWQLENFALLAKKINESGAAQTIVFLGPEEAALRDKIRREFPPPTIILEKLSLAELFAAFARLDVLISNDTGPTHLAAIAGAKIVLLMDEQAPITYLPLTEKIHVLNHCAIGDIEPAEVFQTAREFLTSE